MGYIRLEAGEWVIKVPFSLEGIEVVMKFIELLDKMLTEAKAKG